MVQKKTNSNFNLKGRKRQKLIVSGFFVFFATFALAYVLGSEVMAAMNSSAAEVVAAIENSGEHSISLSSQARISANINAIPEGATVSMKDTLNVKTNVSTGYNIYLSMNNANENGNRMYLNGTATSDSNKYINPVASATFTAPKNLTSNTWGYALPGKGGFNATYTTGDILNGAYKFASVPLRGNEERIISSNTAATGTGTNYDIYYGVNANTALNAGTYTATVVYSAVTNSSLRDTAAVSPSEVSSLSGGDEITITTNLMATVSEVQSAASSQGVPVATVTVGDADCTNIRLYNSAGNNIVIKCYTPAKATDTYDIRVSIPSYSKNYFISNGLTYAAPETTVFGISYMQDMTPARCASVPTPNSNATETSTSLERIRNSVNQNTGKASLVAEAVLTDNRDNKQYIVRKMPDGNCWMSQNLDLDLTVKDSNGQFATAAEGKTGQVYAKKLNSTDTTLLTKDNTDISGDNWTINDNNIGYATQTSTGTRWHQTGSNNPSAMGTGNNTYEVRSYDPGDECIVNNGSSTEMGEDVVASSCTRPSTAHVGNYYNWSGATAGSGTYSVGTQYRNVNDSICPKNWDLPTGSQSSSTGGQWNVLLKNISGITATGGTNSTSMMTAPIMWAMTSTPYSLVRAGHYDYDSGVISNQGSDGRYWSSTAADSSYNAYNFGFDSSNIFPGTLSSNKGRGRSVRCVASSSYNYSLSYNLNGGEMVVSGLETKTGVTDNGATTTITIPKIEPQKENQVFLGWAESEEDASEYKVTHRLYDGSENHDGTGSNKITLTASNPNKTLYAVWADDMTKSANINKCKNGTESTTTVTDYIMADPRDKKLYVTRKLKDGQCWMAQNLDLDLAMSSTTMGTTNTVTNDFVKFTNGNTNLSGSEWTVVSPNAGYATQIAAGTAWDTYGRNGGDNSTYEVRSYDIDKGEPSKACYTNGTTARACTTAVGAADVTRAGNYYNWPAATAGTGTYSISSGDVADSICPAGWQLPYGNDGAGTNDGNTAKGFYYLLNSLATSSDAPLLIAPYNYLRADYYSVNGYMHTQSSDGSYWSRTSNNTNIAYSFSFGSSYMRPGTDNSNKGGGISVRCVAQ